MVYFDNAATTRLNPNVARMMKENLDLMWFNPSASYAPNYRKLIEKARKSILRMIGADERDHLIFTSGGSEANALAINGQKFVTSAIEHTSILNATSPPYISVDSQGFIKFEEVEDLPQGYMVSFQLANNEIGTIQDIERFRELHPLTFIHTDAVQAIGHIAVDVKKLGVDMLSASAHKFGGPKGVGFLYVSDRAYSFIHPVIFGEQENEKRGSTYNALGIVAMEMALREAIENFQDNYLKTVTIRNDIEYEMSRIPEAILNGPTAHRHRLPGNLNYRFRGYRGEELQTFLAEHAVYVSTGSACNSASNEPSHVLKAIGLSSEEANSSIRISVNERNTVEDVGEFIRVLKLGLEMLHD